MPATRGPVQTFDGRDTVDDMTTEGVGYLASEYADFLLWRWQLAASDYVLYELMRPPVGQELNVWGVIAQPGFGTIRVYIVAPDGSVEMISDNSISTHYILPSGANMVIYEGGRLAVTTVGTLTGAAWVHVYGKIV